MANDLLDLTDLDHFGFVDGDVAPAHIDAGVAIVRSWCRWHVAPSRTETLTVDGDGSCVLQLPSLHVTELGTVSIGDDEVTSFAWSTHGVVELITGQWPAGRRNITVAVTHGHDLDDVADLRAVAAAVAARLPAAVGGTDTDPLALPDQLGQLRIHQADGAGGVALTAAEERMLGAYRLP